jgi:hypothetical protein
MIVDLNGTSRKLGLYARGDDPGPAPSDDRVLDD